MPFIMRNKHPNNNVQLNLLIFCGLCKKHQTFYETTSYWKVVRLVRCGQVRIGSVSEIRLGQVGSRQKQSSLFYVRQVIIYRIIYSYNENAQVRLVQVESLHKQSSLFCVCQVIIYRIVYYYIETCLGYCFRIRLTACHYKFPQKIKLIRVDKGRLLQSSLVVLLFSRKQ